MYEESITRGITWLDHFYCCPHFKLLIGWSCDQFGYVGQRLAWSTLLPQTKTTKVLNKKLFKFCTGKVLYTQKLDKANLLSKGELLGRESRRWDRARWVYKDSSSQLPPLLVNNCIFENDISWDSLLIVWKILKSVW